MQIYLLGEFICKKMNAALKTFMCQCVKDGNKTRTFRNITLSWQLIFHLIPLRLKELISSIKLRFITRIFKHLRIFPATTNTKLTLRLRQHVDVWMFCLHNFQTLHAWCLKKRILIGNNNSCETYDTFKDLRLVFWSVFPFPTQWSLVLYQQIQINSFKFFWDNL